MNDYLLSKVSLIKNTTLGKVSSEQMSHRVKSLAPNVACVISGSSIEGS
jgi:hypothetical protein